MRRLAMGLSSLIIMTCPRQPILQAPVGVAVPNGDAWLYFILPWPIIAYCISLSFMTFIASSRLYLPVDLRKRPLNSSGKYLITIRSVHQPISSLVANVERMKSSLTTLKTTLEYTIIDS